MKRGQRSTALLGLLVTILTCAAYWEALDGVFVYDDVKQIVGNHLIRDHRQLGTALTSDVWAFKGARNEAWSHYWRPTFVLWLTTLYNLFGVRSPVPWHVTNLALHIGASLLGFLVLRRVGLSLTLAAAATVVFAVHPVHVESVAWISGSPDLLATAAFFLSLLLFSPGAERVPLERTVGSALAFCLALGAKEMAVVLPLVMLAAHHAAGGRLERRLFARWLPFPVLSVFYLIARSAVIGGLQVELPWSFTLLELFVTIPHALAFYLRQSFVPLVLGPNYGLRAIPVTPSSLAVAVSTVAACMAVVWTLRGKPQRLFGVALFIIPLAPALNMGAFQPEQLVHDRYLYLPVLGILVVVLASGRTLVETHPRAFVTMAILVSLVAAARTAEYAGAWTTEVRLWSRAVETDPSSAHSWAQLGDARLLVGDITGAETALAKSLEIAPVTAALINRAKIFRGRGDHASAIRDLELVRRHQPDYALAYEELAVTLQQAGAIDRAIQVLREGRDRFPFRRCAFGSNLGVLLYVSGERARALSELEAAQKWVGREPTPACHLAAFHLGNLYEEQGRPGDARIARQRYLDASERATDPTNRARRAELLAKPGKQD